MTIGFAATILRGDGSWAFLLAADCRYSTSQSFTDTGIKTHALDRTTGAVVAGNALSVASAVEMTRGIADDHNRLQPQAPINFYSTVRLFAYFLNRIEQESPWSQGCEVALVGRLSNGMPAIAKVTTRPSAKAEVHIYAHKVPGSLFLFVGQREGKEQIFLAVRRAFESGRGDWLERAVGTIAYLCEHNGQSTIGGSPAVAVCSFPGVLHWPILVMDNRTYLRGFDITSTSPPSPAFEGDQRIHLHYDQAWHAAVDQCRTEPAIKLDASFVSKSWLVEDWVPPVDAFSWKHEPDVFQHRPDLSADPEFVGIVRPDEVTWTHAAESTKMP